jgi:dCTP deaminase
MVLVDRQIKSEVGLGRLGIDNFGAECVQPASYDLRIGHLVYAPPNPDKPFDLSHNGGIYKIPPYGNAVLMTYETLKMPSNILGRIGLKSGFARRGLFASTGPQVDPGFQGKLFVSLLNLMPLSHVISYKETFLTIEFHTLDQEPEKTYDGPYQGLQQIGHEVLEDLLRVEGFNLNQMQVQFTELAEHVKQWSALAARFDEFLTEMTRHTKAIERLSRMISKGEAKEESYKPVKARRVNLKQAANEILALFKKRKRLFYSDIADTLRLDFATVINACQDLERKGLIEGEGNGTARTKRSRG